MSDYTTMNEADALVILGFSESAPYDAGMIERAYSRRISFDNLFDRPDTEYQAARICLLLARARKLYKDSPYRVRVSKQLAETDPDSLGHIVCKWEEWEADPVRMAVEHVRHIRSLELI